MPSDARDTSSSPLGASVALPERPISLHDVVSRVDCSLVPLQSSELKLRPEADANVGVDTETGCSAMDHGPAEEWGKRRAARVAYGAAILERLRRSQSFDLEPWISRQFEAQQEGAPVKGVQQQAAGVVAPVTEWGMNSSVRGSRQHPPL